MGDKEPRTLDKIYYDLLAFGDIALRVIAVRVGENTDKLRDITVGRGYGRLDPVVDEGLKALKAKRQGTDFDFSLEVDPYKIEMFNHLRNRVTLELTGGARNNPDLFASIADRKELYPHLPYGALDSALVLLVNRMVPPSGFSPIHPSGR